MFTRGYAQTHVYKISVYKGFQWVLFVATHTLILSARGPLRLMGIQTTTNVAKITHFGYHPILLD